MELNKHGSTQDYRVVNLSGFDTWASTAVHGMQLFLQLLWPELVYTAIHTLGQQYWNLHLILDKRCKLVKIPRYLWSSKPPVPHVITDSLSCWHGTREFASFDHSCTTSLDSLHTQTHIEHMMSIRSCQVACQNVSAMHCEEEKPAISQSADHSVTCDQSAQLQVMSPKSWLARKLRVLLTRNWQFTVTTRRTTLLFSTPTEI